MLVHGGIDELKYLQNHEHAAFQEYQQQTQQWEYFKQHAGQNSSSKHFERLLLHTEHGF